MGSAFGKLGREGLGVAAERVEQRARTLAGIGQDLWTAELFIKAIREGKHFGTSRPILPPMPWPVYRNMTDDDLKAVFAYLRTVPAVNNHVPEPIINEPPKK